MYKNKRISVTIPAYNEEKFIGKVIDTLPKFVDKIYVVNDASTDRTLEISMQQATHNSKIVVINREIRGGVGAAILSGHIRAIKENMDVLVVMAGDGQMDPAILDNFVTPIAENRADYTKGNRLHSHEHRKEMPIGRTLGSFMLSILTRIASGYWSISDPQNGYTAISALSLKKLDIGKIERGFAFENDMLVKLNVIGARVMDIPHPALYRGQNSKIRYSHFIINTSIILLKDCVWRIWVKHLKNNSFKNARGDIND